MEKGFKKNPSSISYFQAAKTGACLNNNSGKGDHYGFRGQSKKMLVELIQNIKLLSKSVVVMVIGTNLVFGILLCNFILDLKKFSYVSVLDYVRQSNKSVL